MSLIFVCYFFQVYITFRIVFGKNRRENVGSGYKL